MWNRDSGLGAQHPRGETADRSIAISRRAKPSEQHEAGHSNCFRCRHAELALVDDRELISAQQQLQVVEAVVSPPANIRCLKRAKPSLGDVDKVSVKVECIKTSECAYRWNANMDRAAWMNYPAQFSSQSFIIAYIGKNRAAINLLA